MIRLSDSALEMLLRDLESDLVERKASFRGDTPKKGRQAVCAFANDLPNHNKPGVLFIGVNDDGTPSGEPITDELLRALADIKTDGNVIPLPVLTVEKRVLLGVEIAVLMVMPSDMPPVRYEGRIWVRTGPRRSIANAQEERILNEKRRFKDLPFDLTPIPGAKLSDLSRTIFESEYLNKAFAEDILEQNGRTYEERLASCRMVYSVDDPTPTVIGLLAIGISPQDFLIGAYIQFLRVNGVELTDPVVDSQEIRGNIVEILRLTNEKLKSHNRIEVNVEAGSTHQIMELYPIIAVQQILYNAVLHRAYESTYTPIRVYWFNDRIEINSPGGPFGNVTVTNFGQPGVTDYRNPSLADVLKTFGFVQGFGRGIAIAKRLMEENGNPPLDFEVNQSTVLCTLRKKV